MTVAGLCIIGFVAILALGRYLRWRQARPLIARPEALWALTLAYEPKARERRL